MKNERNVNLGTSVWSNTLLVNKRQLSNTPIEKINIGNLLNFSFPILNFNSVNN